MAVFEIHSRVTHRSLMNRSKHELASRVLELMDRLDRERARLDEVKGEVRLLAYPYGKYRFGPATIEPDFTDLCRIVGLKAEDF